MYVCSLKIEIQYDLLYIASGLMKCINRGRQIEFLSTCPRTGGYQNTGCPTGKFARPTFFHKIEGKSKIITMIHFIIV
jgi:hypothetical protein